MNYKSEDVTIVYRLSLLKELKLSSRKLKSLKGIDKLCGLEILELRDCAHLNSIDIISKVDSIKVLILDTCRKIGDLSPLADLKKLKWLSVINCGEIKSLKPLERCLELEVLKIGGGTKMLDGRVNWIHGAFPELKELVIAPNAIRKKK